MTGLVPYIVPTSNYIYKHLIIYIYIFIESWVRRYLKGHRARPEMEIFMEPTLKWP